MDYKEALVEMKRGKFVSQESGRYFFLGKVGKKIPYVLVFPDGDSSKIPYTRAGFLGLDKNKPFVVEENPYYKH